VAQQSSIGGWDKLLMRKIGMKTMLIKSIRGMMRRDGGIGIR
jgi:hypothetical protein